MNFRIADTFTDSLARLTSEEQKSVKTTVFDLQVDPSNPGMQFYKLDQAKDKNFRSVRLPDTDRTRPCESPKPVRIEVKVINHLGDEVKKVFRV